MNEIIDVMSKAYDMLATVEVCGMNVDKVAMVRQYMRDAYQMLRQMEDSAADKSAEGETADG